jgi:D-beta-D-heptose 7-phosphate kinase/D-beta-D-heptose 1-phosphate adenosyltransferase
MTARRVAIPRARIEEVLRRFAGQRILVLGDAMLDRYLWGTVSRISPEAPVPIVEVSEETVRLGGAANVADNVSALGGEPVLIAVTGDDQPGAVLRATLVERGLRKDMLVTDSTRRTTQKTRIVAHQQQVVRADQEDTTPIGPDTVSQIRERVERNLDGAGALVISDYGKGVIERELLFAVLGAAEAAGVPVCVDPKESHFDAYEKASVITPNLSEAGSAYGRRITSEVLLEEVGFGLIKRVGCRAVLITRSEQGMSLFEPPAEHTHFPTVAQEVYDVTGAGDTVIAALAMALAAGADFKEAALISNHAAGIVIREVGTASTTVDELGESFDENGS